MKAHILGLAGAFLLTGCIGVAVDEADHATEISHYGSEAMGGTVLPFSKAVVAGDTIYLAGEVGSDPATGSLVTGGIGAETSQIIANMQTTLNALDADLSDIVKCTVFIDDMSKYGEMNAAYKTALPDPKPARATVAVTKLALGASIEIDCIAVKS